MNLLAYDMEFEEEEKMAVELSQGLAIPDAWELFRNGTYCSRDNLYDVTINDASALLLSAKDEKWKAEAYKKYG